MSWSFALVIALIVALVCVVALGRLLVDKELLLATFAPDKVQAQHMLALSMPLDQPPMVEKVPRAVSEAVEALLLPLAEADPELLPTRLDKVFRRQIEHQIAVLRRAGLRRIFRFTEVDSGGGFKTRNDYGREWREAWFQAVVLEQLVDRNGNIVEEIYHPATMTTIRQSRRIRHDDRPKKGKKGNQATKNGDENHYGEIGVRCPSCGEPVELAADQVVCTSCGAVIERTFFDWQTESFDIADELTLRTESYLVLGGLFLFVTLTGTLSLRLAGSIEMGLLLWLALIALIGFGIHQLAVARPKRMRNQIVRFSPGHLRACINAALWEAEPNLNPDGGLLSFHVGSPEIKRVHNTEDTTHLELKVPITRSSLSPSGMPQTTKTTRHVQAERARHPERVGNKGEIVRERECPSCGANFMPDADNACGYCGYSLRVSNANWRITLD